MTASRLNHPPQVPLALSVGVTGHRQDALLSANGNGLRARLTSALRQLAAEVEAIHQRQPQFFAAEAHRLIFVSPLADGADQMAAEVALELGFELHVVLPFRRESYRGLLGAEAQPVFNVLIERAACVLQLPGDPEHQLDAYVMTGRATIAHCDLLVAVWDGLPPRGRGGTGEVAELALVAGTPVIHVPIDEQPTRFLWSAFDPAVVTHGLEKTTERSFDARTIAQVLAGILLPPADPQERTFLGIFAKERSRRIRARIEYPLLLAAAGVARFDARKMREVACAADIREEWIQYRAGCADAHDIAAPLDVLEASYSWADRLATHFAQTYRSGHIFNFVLGGLAVCMGLSAFMLPGRLFELAIAEAVITLGIILNTQVGVRNEWHRRWLDYRQLAERLRPMRSLKLLALAAPDPPGSLANPVPRRWIDWYALGIWRAMGCPAGAIDGPRAAELAKGIAAYEIAPQVAYHDRHARQVDTLDRRLEKLAGLLFLATLLVSATVVVGLATGAEWVGRYNDWFTLVSAGFPALGTAVFGIRFQGDFGGSAVRSQTTANALREIDQELRKEVSLQRAADLTEQAARIMLSDLDEWRLVNQQQDLDLV